MYLPANGPQFNQSDVLSFILISRRRAEIVIDGGDMRARSSHRRRLLESPFSREISRSHSRSLREVLSRGNQSLRAARARAYFYPQFTFSISRETSPFANELFFPKQAVRSRQLLSVANSLS